MTEQSLIQLTDAAANHIASIIRRHQGAAGFRLSVKATGCSGYRYMPKIVAEEGQDDIRVDTKQGITVFIDYEWLPILSGTVIDLVEEDLGQKKLIYRNPNVDDECGCGESFNLKRDDGKE